MRGSCGLEYPLFQPPSSSHFTQMQCGSSQCQRTRPTKRVNSTASRKERRPVGYVISQRIGLANQHPIGQDSKTCCRGSKYLDLRCFGNDFSSHHQPGPYGYSTHGYQDVIYDLSRRRIYCFSTCIFLFQFCTCSPRFTCQAHQANVVHLPTSLASGFCAIF
jgi:hypothetical protein